MGQLLALAALDCGAAYIHTCSHQVLYTEPPVLVWQRQDCVQELDHPNPKPETHGTAKGGQQVGPVEAAVVPVGHLHLVGEGDVYGGVGDILLHLIQEVGASGGRCAWQRTDFLRRHQSSFEEIAVDPFDDVGAPHPLRGVNAPQPKGDEIRGVLSF